MGRPTKLTPEIQERILSAIRSGAFQEAAAEFAGVGTTTYYRWLAKGAEDDAEPLYREFRNAVMAERAAVVVRNAALINKAAADGDWKAGAWWLERSFPDQYGRRTNLAGPNGGAIEVKTDDQEREDRLRQLVAKALDNARNAE